MAGMQHWLGILSVAALAAGAGVAVTGCARSTIGLHNC
jgi:hypothetical protein